MRKVRCEDCGKVYDYDVDDFCPRCGSFNPPSGKSAAQPVKAAASGRTAGSRPAGQGAPRRVSYPSDLDGVKRKKGGSSKIVAVIVALLVFVAPLIVELVGIAADAVYDWSESIFSGKEEPAPERDQAVAPALPAGSDMYESYDTIILDNGQQISVADGWEPWLPDEITEQYPDTRCVAVGLWVLGEPGGENIPLTLMTEDGASYLPEDLPTGLLEECGLDRITLADGVADEELFGYNFYFLPEDAAGQALTAALLGEENVYISIDMEWE